jgi:ferredoxin
MKLLILYFSGTGNTDYVARYLAAGLTDLPIRTEVRSIEQVPADRVRDFDLLALGFPVYACEAPRLLVDYVDSLEAGAGRGVLVFCTKGAFTGNAVVNMLRRMEQRGYVSLGGGGVGMPGSDGLPFLRQDSWVVRAALNKDYDNLPQADKLTIRLRNAIQQLIDGCSAAQLRCQPRSKLAGLLLGWLVSASYRWLEGRLRHRLWVDERCVACGYCVRICPTQNIRIAEGHPAFENRCQLCMRCIHCCPEQAIQLGKNTIGKFRWQGPKAQFDPLEVRPDGRED